MTPEQTLQVKSLVDRSDVFNYVVDHLRRQGRKSVIFGGLGPYCAYRGLDANPTMCAIGALITDDEYDREWEGISVANLLGGHTDLWLPEPPPNSLLERLAPHEEMLIDLQSFHDGELSYTDGVFSQCSEKDLARLREKWNIE